MQVFIFEAIFLKLNEKRILSIDFLYQNNQHSGPSINAA